ncbi:hypothetical protein BGZ83_001687 [Gryganskiella cystojenkinii]|nr:hypothetical protein BGZ83_001687 [Gryganskiella cystojenkinii]
MTRAATNRKHSSGSSAAASTTPEPVFRGRDVVFVDPLDDKESYWWPAMIVPVPEIDSTMDCRVLNPGECLVKYFEDNKYSVVPFSDLQPFVPTTIPFLEFELAAGQKFLKNSGVLNALAYLDAGKVKRKFSWNRWGSAQDQDLSMDLNKLKAITLPLVSDELYNQSQTGNNTNGAGSSTWSPASSSFTDHETENNGDPMTATDITSAFSSAAEDTTATSQSPLSGTDLKKQAEPEALNSSSATSSTRQTKGEHLKNGLQRPQANSTANHSALPSPVSLEDLTASGTTGGDQSGTEFSVRSTKGTSGTTKDSPTRARSRRGSRDDAIHAAPGNNNNNSSTQSRNTSENSSLSSPSGLTVNTATSATTASSNNGSPVSMKRALSESMKKTGTVTGSVSGRSSRQGSVEPASSPRSTRHSSRGSKTTEDPPSKAAEEDAADMAVDDKATSPLRIKTQRMSRTRSVPKNGSASLSPRTSQTPTTQSSKIWSTGDGSVKDESTTKMSVDAPEGKDLVMATSAATSKLNGTLNLQTSDQPIEHSSVVSSSSSSTPSPASLEPDESNDGTTTLHYLDQDRQTVIYNFDHVLPTLPIGSKEREVIYDTCMEHLQKLRKEHRRLKEVLKGSEFALRGRRATRSSPLYASLQHSRNRHDRVDSPGAPATKSTRNKNNNNNNSSNNTQESSTNGTTSDSETTKADQNASTAGDSSFAAAESAAEASSSPAPEEKADSPPKSPSPPPPPIFTGSTPSSAILTSNISATTRRSAAAAAAIAVTAVINRGRSASSKPSESKKRAASLSANATAAAAAAAATAGDGREVLTRAKRRMR